MRLGWLAVVAVPLAACDLGGPPEVEYRVLSHSAGNAEICRSCPARTASATARVKANRAAGRIH